MSEYVIPVGGQEGVAARPYNLGDITGLRSHVPLAVADSGSCVPIFLPNSFSLSSTRGDLISVDGGGQAAVVNRE